jgi:acetyl esterase/lipase
VTATNIAYAAGTRRKLDVYPARAAAGAPVIVFFYGGRWQWGAKGWYRLLGAALAARGYVTVVPDYRLYPEVKFPDFVIDGAEAVRWTQQNIAHFGGDPRRVFVMGHSAGAYIAGMLALDPQWLTGVGLNADRDIAGLVGLSGPYDFLPLRDADLIDMFGGANRAVTQPISFADGRKPPALLLTGASDNIVDPGNTTRVAERLLRSGNDATAVAYPRFGHRTIIAGLAPILASFLPQMRDVQAFVARVGADAPRRLSLGAAVP